MCYYDSCHRELSTDVRCVENGGRDMEVLSMQVCGFANFTLFSNSWLAHGRAHGYLTFAIGVFQRCGVDASRLQFRCLGLL
jgi:hypothetical protein